MRGSFRRGEMGGPGAAARTGARGQQRPADRPHHSTQKRRGPREACNRFDGPPAVCGLRMAMRPELPHRAPSEKGRVDDGAAFVRTRGERPASDIEVGKVGLLSAFQVSPGRPRCDKFPRRRRPPGSSRRARRDARATLVLAQASERSERNCNRRAEDRSLTTIPAAPPPPRWRVGAASNRSHGVDRGRGACDVENRRCGQAARPNSGD